MVQRARAPTGSAFVRSALALPEAEEGSHFGKRDFRVRGKIFASLPTPRQAVLKLTIEEQELLTSTEPDIFFRIPGGWGRKGWTSVALDKCDGDTLTGALRMAWRNVAPTSLRSKFG